jgi:hypothetical protein
VKSVDDVRKAWPGYFIFLYVDDRNWECCFQTMWCIFISYGEPYSLFFNRSDHHVKLFLHIFCGYLVFCYCKTLSNVSHGINLRGDFVS